MSQNSAPRRITVAEMSPHVHSFLSGENKVNKISGWLISWIEKSLSTKSIKPYDLLPLKEDLAFHIGVSKGTIQNVFRNVEDYGLVESKQRIGTYIKPSSVNHSIEKLTSKREIAVETIKEFLVNNEYKSGDYLPATRKLGDIIGISAATTRMAISSLITDGIIKKEGSAFVVCNLDFDIEKVELQTLVEKIAANIKKYVEEECKIGDKLLANFDLAKKFGVSVKTIHDAIKLLSKDGILFTRRGQYGTIVLGGSAKNELYFYERVEQKIIHYIADNCEVGVKLPAITEFAQMYQVSAKTIKKALDNLADEGYITFVRGRYGGTFVMDIPQVNEAYKWLALNPAYTSGMEN